MWVRSASVQPPGESGTTLHFLGLRRKPAAALAARKTLESGRSWRCGSATRAATSSAKPRTDPVGDRTRRASRRYGSSTMTNAMPDKGQPWATPALIFREIGVVSRRRIVASVDVQRR